MIERELLQSLLSGTISLGLILVGLWLIIKWILPKLLKSQQDYIDTLVKLLSNSREDQRELTTALRDVLAALMHSQDTHEERSKSRYEAVVEKLEPRR